MQHVAERTVSITAAKTDLSKLVAAAESGEAIVITKRGKPVAELRGRNQPRVPVDLDVLLEATMGMDVANDGADAVRQPRDEARY